MAFEGRTYTDVAPSEDRELVRLRKQLAAKDARIAELENAIKDREFKICLLLKTYNITDSVYMFEDGDSYDIGEIK